VTTIARPPPYSDFSMGLPDGGLMIEDPRNGRRSLLLSANGRLRARIDVPAGACRLLHIDMVSPFCIVSADHRTLAIMSGTVRLFRLPERQIGPSREP